MTVVAGFSSPKGEQTYRRIVDATLQVIADEGVRAVTHRRVARQAQASPGLISYYFSTTEELIQGTLTDIAARECVTYDRLRARVEEIGNDLPALVELFVAEVMTRAGSEKVSTTATLALTLELAGQRLDRETFEAWETSQFGLYDATVQVLGGQAPGGQSDLDLSMFLSSAIDGLFLTAVIMPNPELLESVARTGLTALFGGLQVREQPVTNGATTRATTGAARS